MTYSEFTEALLSFVRMDLPEECSAKLHTVIKNNDTRLTGLTITETGRNIAPTIYLDHYYEKYCEGMEVNQIVDEIVQTYLEYRPREDFDMTFFTDYEKVKDRIVYKLVNRERNKELLQDVPYVPFLDLAVVFCCLLRDNPGGSATVLIRQKHMELWHVTTKDLFALAKENSPRLLSYELEDMNALMKQICGEDTMESGQMYVLSNRQRLFGASCILDETLMEQIAKEQDSGFYVLPSSIHEVILLPRHTPDTSEALSRMVQEINATHLSSEEVLSDHVYYYDFKQKKLCV